MFVVSDIFQRVIEQPVWSVPNYVQVFEQVYEEVSGVH